MPTKPIYLDYNATTPVDPKVAGAMWPFVADHFGNPSSTHELGKHADRAVEAARAQLASLLGCGPAELVFTSCATESSNLAIKGVALAKPSARHLVTSATEHPATSGACGYLEKFHGFTVTRVGVSSDGLIDPDEVKRALRPDTALVSLIHAHNETGVLQPIREVSEVTRAAGVPLHVDAAQSVGKLELSVDSLGCDLLTVAGHKLYAPKGVGALYVRSGVALEPHLHGASYERGRRAGTLNVAQVVGLGVACELAKAHLTEGEAQKLRTLRDRLLAGLAELRPVLFGHPTKRLPNTLYLAVPESNGAPLRAASWLEATPGVAASTGSACHSGVDKPSAVLLAMGVSASLAMGAVRLSVGRFTTEEEVDTAARLLVESRRRLAG